MIADEEMLLLARWVHQQQLTSASPTGYLPNHIGCDIFGKQELTQEMRYRYVGFINAAAKWIVHKFEKEGCQFKNGGVFESLRDEAYFAGKAEEKDEAPPAEGTP